MNLTGHRYVLVAIKMKTRKENQRNIENHGKYSVPKMSAADILQFHICNCYMVRDPVHTLPGLRMRQTCTGSVWYHQRDVLENTTGHLHQPRRPITISGYVFGLIVTTYA